MFGKRKATEKYFLVNVDKKNNEAVINQPDGNIFRTNILGAETYITCMTANGYEEYPSQNGIRIFYRKS